MAQGLPAGPWRAVPGGDGDLHMDAVEPLIDRPGNQLTLMNDTQRLSPRRRSEPWDCPARPPDHKIIGSEEDAAKENYSSPTFMLTI